MPRKIGICTALFLAAILLSAYTVVPCIAQSDDTFVLVMSDGQEYYNFTTDSSKYSVFAVKRVTHTPPGLSSMTIWDNPEHSGASLAFIQLTLPDESPRHLGFIARYGPSMGETLNTYVRVNWKDGYQYIYEMENGASSGVRDLTIGSEINGFMSTSGIAGQVEIIDAYQVHLETGQLYCFELDVPSPNDYDLYLIYDDLSTSKNYLSYSTNTLAGVDEKIYFSPRVTGDYCLIVTNPELYSSDYAISANLVDVSDTPILVSHGTGPDAAPGNYVFDTETDSLSLLAMRCRTSDPQISPFNPSVNFYDTPGYESGAITQLGPNDIKWGEIAYMGFILRDGHMSGDPFRTYVKIGYQWSFQYTLELEVGGSTGMIPIGLGETKHGHMNTSEIIDAYFAWMIAGGQYEIQLEVPPEKDYDLWLLGGDLSSSIDYTTYSSTDAAGADETISFSPSTTQAYCIIVTNREGYESDYSLTLEGEVSTTSTTTETTTETEPTTTPTTTTTTSTNGGTSPPSPSVDTQNLLFMISGWAVAFIALVIVIKIRRD